MSTYNKDNIVTIIINFRLPLVIFKNIKLNIKKIRQSYIKKRLFFYFIYIFSNILSINPQYGIYNICSIEELIGVYFSGEISFTQD